MKRLAALVLLLSLGLPLSPAAGQHITFRHLTTDHGLSQIGVFAMYIDEMNFVWIGTREGLNRYDGNRITTYKLRKDDDGSLFCNNIFKLTGDGRGNLYILTEEGIARYDMAADRFTTIIRSLDIKTFCYRDKLWFGRQNEILSYNPADGTISVEYTMPSARCFVSALHAADDGAMYVGTREHGLYTLRDNSTLSCLLSPVSGIVDISGGSDGSVWVGTTEDGLFRFKGERRDNYRTSTHGLASDYVRTCCEETRGNIWIGTFNGLSKLDRAGGTLTNYLPDGEPDGLTHNSIWSIVRDRQGTMWLGTYFGGVNYFNPEYEIYTWYKPSEDSSCGLSSPIVGHILEDGNDRIWICTEGGGVNIYDRGRGKYTWYGSGDGRTNISGSNVKAICHDPSRGEMWVGTHMGGLSRIDLGSGRVTQYRSVPGDRETIVSDLVRSLVMHRGKLIVGTEEGVSLFDPATGRAEPFFDDPAMDEQVRKVLYLHIDTRDILWISVSGEGVFSYDRDTGRLTNYRHDPADQAGISNNNINSIYEDSRGNIYFCTSGRGLDLYDYRTDRFRNYDSQGSGLASDCVYNIRETPAGRLLVTTNAGLSVFDPREGNFRNHTAETGFPLSTVNENALYVSGDGTVYLGGVKGMLSFHEKHLYMEPAPYDILFTRLLINGREIGPRDGTGLLDVCLPMTDRLTLHSSHSHISIEYSSRNYIPMSDSPVLYRLEGFSDGWNTAGPSHMITYTNLDPGKYTLLVRDSADPAIASALRIEILPPFYRTTAAFLVYSLVVLSLAAYLVRSYTQRVELRASLSYEQQRREDIQQLNQSKIRFFTNISHEFRTPLTLIIAHLESLVKGEKFTPAVYDRVLKAYRTSLQMKELVSELLDFRKQEQGRLKLSVGEHDVVGFARRNIRLFEQYAASRQIRLESDFPQEGIRLWFDPRQMNKALNNLVSNALKFTEPGGSVTVSIREDEEAVRLEVRDTGIGIALEHIDNVFDIFYQVDVAPESGSGTGIGLALTKSIVEEHGGRLGVDSVPGKGSVFTITLPKGRGHFPENLPAAASPDGYVPSFTPEDQTGLHRDNGAATPLGDFDRGGKPSMLIAEDNGPLRDMLAGVFSPLYEVTLAADGKEAVRLAASAPFDIIVSDIVMPGMTGTELCRAIKNDPDTCHIPVVFLTAKGETEQHIEGLKTGADDYVTKPFNIELLVSRCNNLVNSRAILREKFSRQPRIAPQMLATNSLDKRFIDKAVGLIERHMGDPSFSVGGFAREMGMSRSKLFSKLKGIAGQSPNDFIVHVRLKKAAVLLKNNPELSVSDIAEMVGFNTARYFTSSFKKTYHITPLSYRKNPD